jgi:ribosomal protein L11 methylase PrmA
MIFPPLIRTIIILVDPPLQFGVRKTGLHPLTRLFAEQNQIAVQEANRVATRPPAVWCGL